MHGFNPLTPMNDRISPYNINTISMQYQCNINTISIQYQADNWGDGIRGFLVDPITNSPN